MGTILVTFEGKVIESCGFHCWIENRGVGVLGSVSGNPEPETDTPIRGHQGTYGYVKIDLLSRGNKLISKFRDFVISPDFIDFN